MNRGGRRDVDRADDIDCLRRLSASLRALAGAVPVIGPQLRQIAHETDTHADAMAVRLGPGGRAR
jgi:hypothetical protein